MIWKKKGLVFCPTGQFGFDKHSFMIPTPIKIGNVLRIFGTVRDEQGIGRIMRIDLDANNPSKIIEDSYKLVLDLGQDGCFDDNGVMPGCFFWDRDRLYMFYMGFQKVGKVKFYAFTGLAVSYDNGENFSRVSEVPVMDRMDNERYVRAIYDVVKKDDLYYIFYSTANKWEKINNNVYGSTKINLLVVSDLLNFNSKINGFECVKIDAFNYRYGHPKVFQHKDKYLMYCNSDNVNKEYGMAKFESRDLYSWVKVENDIERSSSGWDSTMLTYPTLYQNQEKIFMFYNGNNMGETGFGYAELVGSL